jgi:hypothetical protein
MTAPPVRRIAATIGLLVLAPTGAMLAAGTLSPQDAAVRALVTLGACVVGARMASWALYALADGPRVRGLAGSDDRRVTSTAGVEERRKPVAPAEDQRGSASSAASTTAGSN